MEEPIAHHVVLRLRDERVLCRTDADRRRVARSFLERDPTFNLLAFRTVDTHLHALLAVAASLALEFARRVEISIELALRPGSPFAPAYAKPIETQRYLSNAFDYILDQEQHHGLTSDPLHEGSNLPDLLGLRLTGGFTTGLVRGFLPRVRRADLIARLPGGEALDSDEPMGYVHLPHLPAAAAAAACLPHVRGRRPEAVAARAAAVAIAEEFTGPATAARALGISRAAVKRLRLLQPPPALVEAVRRQARLRAAQTRR